MKRNPSKHRRHTRRSDLLTAREHAQAIGTVKKALAYCGIKAAVKGSGGPGSDRGIRIDVARRGYYAYLYPSMGRIKGRSIKGDFYHGEQILWDGSLGDEWASEIQHIADIPDVGTAAVLLACHIIESYIIPEGDGRWDRLWSTKRR
jgi:hypothetical protein